MIDADSLDWAWASRDSASVELWCPRCEEGITTAYDHVEGHHDGNHLGVLILVNCRVDDAPDVAIDPSDNCGSEFDDHNFRGGRCRDCPARRTDE